MPRTLTETIKFLENQSYDSEILVVTDGSSDRTAAVAQSFCDRFPRLRVLEFKEKRGKGFGVSTGILAAQGEYRLFMDADYAVPIEYVTQFIDLAENGFDIVIASRALAESHFEEKQRFPRRQLALVFGELQKMILRLPYKDTQCGFKMFSAEAAQRYFPLLKYECAYFDAELLFIAFKSGAKVAQVPVTWRHDQESRLPIGLKRSLDLFMKLLQIRKNHGHITEQSINKSSIGEEQKLELTRNI